MTGQYNQGDQDEKDISLMAFDQYMRWVRWTPEATDEEVMQLLECVERGRVEQVKPHSDEQVLTEATAARDRLVAAFQPLVIHIAKKYTKWSRSMELLDLIQEGNLGLFQAIERHGVHSGYPLRAAALHWIRGAILNALEQRAGMIRLPHNVELLMQKMQRVRGGLLMELDREPTLAEVAAAMEISVAKVYEVMEVERRVSVESLQGLVVEGTDESDYGFVSLFAAWGEQDAHRQEELHQAVHQAVDTVLTARQQEAIRLRFGLSEEDGCSHTLAETAKLMGMKWRESLETLQHRAIGRLREQLAWVYGSADEQERA